MADRAAARAQPGPARWRVGRWGVNPPIVGGTSRFRFEPRGPGFGPARSRHCARCSPPCSSPPSRRLGFGRAGCGCRRPSRPAAHQAGRAPDGILLCIGSVKSEEHSSAPTIGRQLVFRTDFPRCRPRWHFADLHGLPVVSKADHRQMQWGPCIVGENPCAGNLRTRRRPERRDTPKEESATLALGSDSVTASTVTQGSSKRLHEPCA